MNPTNQPSPDETASREPRMAFSLELRNLAEQFEDRPARLSNILEATQGRGFDLLLVFVTIPFLSPIPLPGLSTPFGLVANDGWHLRECANAGDFRELGPQLIDYFPGRWPLFSRF